MCPVRTVKCWLGREDSNLRMVESKSTALPLGDAPKGRLEKRRDDRGPAVLVWQRRSIEGVEAFQPAGRRNFARDQILRIRALISGCSFRSISISVSIPGCLSPIDL